MSRKGGASGVERGVALHRAGQLDEAERLYRHTLRRDPANADALHYLGLLMHHRGDTEQAIAMVRQATAHAPEYVDAWNNLGNLLSIARRHGEAEAAYRRAIVLRPGDANARSNLATVLKIRGLLVEAEAELRKATELDDHHIAALTNLGHLLSRTGRPKEAIGYYAAATALDPDNPDAPRVLGLAYQASGQIEKAREVFARWLERAPDDPVAAHMLTACSGEGAPGRAADAFVRTVFDRMADRFDEHLADLGYRAPQLVASALAEAWPSPGAGLDVLDAGCGTGLCAAFLRPHARVLVGVDLSSGMLRRAAQLKIYDRLVEDELTRFLGTRAQAYDVVVAADTLCYFGALEEVFVAAARALKPGGRFIFTLEHAAGDVFAGFRLEPHGRYSHAKGYVDAQLEAAGLRVGAMSSADLRRENGKPVAGLVITAANPPG